MSEVKGTKALELWCKRLIKDCPNVQIDNMTTSWRNGIAFCALVHHFRPDLIDISTLKPENIYENNRLAYSIAEKHLGIPSLLDPEDMVENDVPDRLSVLTYLSQFYQRLGHTVNTKHSENDSKFSPEPSTASNVMAPIKFGKIDLDKCAACSLPVYLAQRLIVSHKLYHRRCFRCSKCSGHLNPKNFQVIEGSEFCCDSCKNEKAMSNYVNNNDQIGMLAFNEDLTKSNTELHNEEPIVPKHKTRPQSILEKINMFEKSAEREVNLVEKLSNVSLTDNLESNNKELSTSSVLNTKSVSSTDKMEANLNSGDIMDSSKLYRQNSTENAYKSNVNKFNFLQTQLSGEAADVKSIFDSVELIEEQKKNNNSDNETDINHYEVKEKSVSPESAGIEKSTNNMTDDIRIAKSHNSIAAPIDDCSTLETNESIIIQPQIAISVPPRKKKMLVQSETSLSDKNGGIKKNVDSKVYPDHLNPFSDEEEEGDTKAAPDRRASTNPFGSSEEEDDDVPPILPTSRLPSAMTSTPTKRLISANPFWSDGEEPSSDEESHNGSASMYNSSLATSTPNLQGAPRRKKPRAPPPPAAAASLDDVASECSLGSYTSTVHSDQKSCGAATPKLKKKRAAPTPPDSMSAMSGCGSLDKGFDTSDLRTSTDGRRLKGPAPGLPLPERREVKLQLSPEELQVQLDMLETQQLGLERQGVLIEQMIRDKCEGEDAAPAPQEEVEDLVIQLCELVNEKNDLFRKQTELMYIRRQQRLEQEQADIEHEIRVIQSRPAVNRIDADKAREEQLVARLVTIVRMRDELVQQIDAERRRERQEDLAIASSIASKRAQRSSESNSSSMKSAEVLPTPKKNKVKDKVKKQLKKAKHSLISKKKDDSDKKEEKSEKIKKSK